MKQQIQDGDHPAAVGMGSADLVHQLLGLCDVAVEDRVKVAKEHHAPGPKRGRRGMQYLYIRGQRGHGCGFALKLQGRVHDLLNPMLVAQSPLPSEHYGLLREFSASAARFDLSDSPATN
jgi:hypothetical protein